MLRIPCINTVVRGYGEHKVIVDNSITVFGKALELVLKKYPSIRGIAFKDDNFENCDEREICILPSSVRG
jgi:hypothetical protein